MTIDNYVEFNKEARNVTLHLNGIEIKLTYTRLRQLSADGLDDAIAEAHGFDTSALAEQQMAEAIAEHEAHKTGVLRETIHRALEVFYVDSGALGRDHIEEITDRVLNAVEDNVADDDVVREAYMRNVPKLVLPARKENWSTSVRDHDAVTGWNDCLDRIAILNPSLPTEPDDGSAG